MQRGLVELFRRKTLRMGEERCVRETESETHTEGHGTHTTHTAERERGREGEKGGGTHWIPVTLETPMQRGLR